MQSSYFDMLELIENEQVLAAVGEFKFLPVATTRTGSWFP